MDMALEDVLRLWAVYHYPPLLADDDLFELLLLFIHRLLCECARKEREATTRRLLQTSRS